MISVALCVYNGEKFLAEQLASIQTQTLPVDEIVICDDCSTDNSIKIIEEFTKNTSIKIYINLNDKQLGSTQNFEKCLSLCKGDIIFLCDQDDYWHPEKVEKQVKYLTNNPEIEAVFSDGGIIDQDSELQEGSMWESVMFDEKAQKNWKLGKAYQILYRGYVVTGATLAIRSRILPKLMPFPDGIKTMIHDSWIALLLSLNNQIGFVEEQLINYRIHANQQVGFGKSGKFVSFSERFNRPRIEKIIPIQKEWEKLETIYQLLKNKPEIPSDKMGDLITLKNHLAIRKQLPQNHLLRVVPVIKELIAGNYYDPQKHWWKTLLGDLVE